MVRSIVCFAAGSLRIPPRPGVADAALALLLATSAQVDVWLLGVSGPPAAKAIAAVLTTLPLAWRTTAPVATVALTTGGYALAVVLGLPSDAPVVATLAPLIAVYSLGAHATRPGVAAGVAIAFAAYSVAVAAGAGDDASELIVFAAAVLGALAVGRAVRV